MKSPPQTWNNRVEARRVALGIGKRELAQLIGVKPPTLQHWVDGRIKEILARNALALCRVLDVRMEWLFDGTEPMTAPVADQLPPTDSEHLNTAKPELPKTALAETTAEMCGLIQAALPVRQAAIETTCRFILAAELAALPLIVRNVKEIAFTGNVKNNSVTDEEMALVQQIKALDKDTLECVLALLSPTRLQVASTDQAQG
jgi:DNA-binding XRE family transcriptional regulator